MSRLAASTTAAASTTTTLSAAATPPASSILRGSGSAFACRGREGIALRFGPGPFLLLVGDFTPLRNGAW